MDVVNHVVVDSLYGLSKDSLKTCLVLSFKYQGCGSRSRAYGTLLGGYTFMFLLESNISTFELKPLPFHLRYASLGNSSILPIIVSNSLNELDDEKLLRVEAAQAIS